MAIVRPVYRYFLQTGPWAALLWAASGWLSGEAIVGLSAPKSFVAPSPFSGDQDRKITPIGQLLGDTSISRTRYGVSDIRILGLLAHGRRGAILISIRNGPTKTLTAGVRDPEGWMFDSIEQDRVRISHYGSAFELPIPRTNRGLQTNPTLQ